MREVMAVILNYNSFEDTKKCIKFLSKQSMVPGFCVIDNCSEKEEQKEIEAFCAQNNYTFIENDVNTGYSAGNNLGLREAYSQGYEYALIINPDVEVRKEESDYILNAYKKMQEDKDIAVLGTNIKHFTRGNQNPMRELKFWEDFWWPIIMIRNRVKKDMPYILDAEKSGYCEKLSGCCFFIDLEFAHDMGYLDEGVFMYSEEAILAAKVKKMNKKMYYEKDLTAFHMHRTANEKVSAQSIREYIRSRKYYINEFSRYGSIKKSLASKSLTVEGKVLLFKNSVASRLRDFNKEVD